jgi:transcription elongation factor Elf1
MLDTSRRRKKFRLELPKIKTELQCISCGLKEIRDFQEDDYISKVTGEKCKKCGEDLKIIAIYTPPPKEPTSK